MNKRIKQFITKCYNKEKDNYIFTGMGRTRKGKGKIKNSED